MTSGEFNTIDVISSHGMEVSINSEVVKLVKSDKIIATMSIDNFRSNNSSAINLCKIRKELKSFIEDDDTYGDDYKLISNLIDDL